MQMPFETMVSMVDKAIKSTTTANQAPMQKKPGAQRGVTLRGGDDDGEEGRPARKKGRGDDGDEDEEEEWMNQRRKMLGRTGDEEKVLEKYREYRRDRFDEKGYGRSASKGGKMVCWICGGPHKAVHCGGKSKYFREVSEAEGASPTCWCCGEEGHKAWECPQARLEVHFW